MVLNEVRGAGDPSFAFKCAENSAYLGFEPITGQNTDGGLNADSAHNGKGIGVFFKGLPVDKVVEIANKIKNQITHTHKNK